MSNTPIKDALDKLGSGGEGFELTVEAEKGKDPSGSAEFTKTFGKKDNFGLAAGVRYAKDSWAALGKFFWRP